MNTFKLYIYNTITNFFPENRFYKLKQKMLVWCGLKIGYNFRICSSVKIVGNGTTIIGDNVWIGHNCFILSSSEGIINIGNNVDIAPFAYISTGSHHFDSYERVAGTGFNGKININDGVWIGARVTILPDLTINEFSMIAAGSVVNKDVESGYIYDGCPAKKIKPISYKI